MLYNNLFLFVHALGREYLCKPLDIQDFWIAKPKEATILAPGALYKHKESKRWELNAIAPAGGIDAHILDMIKFAKGNSMGNPFYTLCEACHTSKQSISKQLHIGLGWLLAEDTEHSIMHFHNGATGGFNSFLGVYPKEKCGIIVLTNCRLSILSSIGLVQDYATSIGFESLQYLRKSVLS